MGPSALLSCCLLLVSASGEDADKKYPLDEQLRQLAKDVKDPAYRKLVLERMLLTDLAAEWQRVATADNPESFLKKHGGKVKVLADPELKKAYERRVQVRDDFLDLMRRGYKRYRVVPPFDQGEKAEPAGTVVKKPGGSGAPLGVVLTAPGAARNWPRFRGPTGQGNAEGQRPPLKWDAGGTNLLWRVKVPHRGNSSPVLWGERLFLTGASEGGKERFTYCFRKSDGKLLWQRRAPERKPEPGVREKNGYASATPATDGERVVVFLGSCGLLCYDLGGKLLWKYDELRFDTTHGTGSSPLIYKDKVLFVHDQNRTESVFVALDKRTGKLLWSKPRPRAMTWSTPVVVRVGGHDELIFAGARTVKGYDPDTGKERWSLTGATEEVIPTVVVGKGLVYSASGRNGPVLALRPGGSGDVTETHLAWRAVRNGPHVPSPVYVAGRLYTVSDTGIVNCLDAERGRLIWQRRLSSTFSASPVEANGLIYFCGESGATFVLKAGDRYELAARNDLGAPILASPAVVDDRLFIRTEDELVCVGKKRE